MSYEDEAGYSTSYVIGSLPRDFGYADGADGGELDAETAMSADLKPKILLMGLRRSGKSSIQKVVFHKMQPNETLFLESTNKLTRDDVSTSSFIRFQVWDFPGQIDFFDPTFDADALFGRQCEALIFVLDAQDDYIDALEKLHVTITKAYRINPSIHFEVFIHKVDGLSDDHKIDTQRDIQRRANDDLADEGLDEIKLSYHLTSIYDHSIFEAFSKVVQKLIPQLPTLENLLNIFIANSAIEKAFLFDVVSKIYVATDSSPVDMSSYELCCDFIDVVVDISYIYGLKLHHDDHAAAGGSLATNNSSNGAVAGSSAAAAGGTAASSNSTTLAAAGGLGTVTAPASTPAVTSVSAFDEYSSSSIRLNNGTVLYLREVNQYLALVCLLREESFQQQGIINYNFHCLRRAIQDTLSLHTKTAVTTSHDQQQATSNARGRRLPTGSINNNDDNINDAAGEINGGYSPPRYGEKSVIRSNDAVAAHRVDEITTIQQHHDLRQGQKVLDDKPNVGKSSNTDAVYLGVSANGDGGGSSSNSRVPAARPFTGNGMQPTTTITSTTTTKAFVHVDAEIGAAKKVPAM